MEYIKRISYIIRVPSNTLKYAIPEITKWLTNNDIECRVEFVRDLEQKTKIIAYEFIFDNEEDVIAFKIQWF